MHDLSLIGIGFIAGLIVGAASWLAAAALLEARRGRAKKGKEEVNVTEST